MKVSVIVPSYNKSKSLEETINSVLKQDYLDWELIVVDDNSTDKSTEILKAFEYESRFKLIKLEKNHGANYCRNLGARIASGNYIMFLDADDLLLSDCLERRMNFISQNTDVDFAVFPMATFYNKIGDSKYVWHPKKEMALERFLSHDLPWQTMQPLWRKESFLKLGGFDENFKRMQDVELHTRALLNKMKFEVSPHNYLPDCYYRIDTHRITNINWFIESFSDSVVMYYRKFYSEVFRLGLRKSLYFMLVELSVYLENLAKQCKADVNVVLKYRAKFLALVAENKIMHLMLKLIFVVYSGLRVYPRGLKWLLKILIRMV